MATIRPTIHDRSTEKALAGSAGWRFDAPLVAAGGVVGWLMVLSLGLATILPAQGLAAQSGLTDGLESLCGR